MSREREDQERPCLHCMMVELIDDFFAEYPATAGSDKVDTAEADEVIDAIAKTVAELTSQQDGVIRQQLLEELTRRIMHYDDEFRSCFDADGEGSNTDRPVCDEEIEIATVQAALPREIAAEIKGVVAGLKSNKIIVTE